MKAAAISIPEDERSLADNALLQAICLGEGIDGLQDSDRLRVLSVMIHDRLTADDLDRFPALEAVITRSDGYDHLPLDVLRERNIRAYHLEGYATDSVAHLTLAMLLMLARRLPEAMERTRTSFDRHGLAGRHLADMVVGVIGLGRIGRRVVELLDALGIATLGYDPEPVTLGTLRHHRRALSLRDLQQADCLSIHVPLNDQTRHLIDAPFLAGVPAGTFLVNTARGAVVDEEAVLEALRSGRLAGYGADVMVGEPTPPMRAALRELPNVVLTPHVGALSRDTMVRRYVLVAKITDAVLAGRAHEVRSYQLD